MKIELQIKNFPTICQEVFLFKEPIQNKELNTNNYKYSMEIGKFSYHKIRVTWWRKVKNGDKYDLGRFYASLCW